MGHCRYSARAVSLEHEAKQELRALADVHRLRVPRVVEGKQGPTVIVDGVEVTSFASNDYLGLAGDERLVRAAANALESGGTGVGASRLIVGNHRAHVELEAAIADWMRVDGVRLFNTGYAANTGVLTALLRDGDVVFSDELNHASIVDGCRLSRAAVEIFKHRDLGDLERRLRARTGRRRIVVSESVFSMDGDVADVAAIAAICRRANAAFVLDEAHALGVCGPEGRGVAAGAGVVPDVLVGTFGKALGSFGAFAATTKAVADLLWNRARPFVFSTGLPPSVAASSAAAIEVVRGGEGSDRRQRLAANAYRFRELVPGVLGSVEIPIAPIVVGDDQRADAIGKRLLAEKQLVASVRPPTVPVGTSRLRASFCALHDRDQVERLASITQRVMSEA
jgi:8-amino-7-oxononanoate synthase